MESVLRYGLPAQYVGLILKVRHHGTLSFCFDPTILQPDPQSIGKILNVLSNELSYVSARGNKSEKKGGDDSEERDRLPGEYQTLLEQEFFNFVLCEIPWIQLDS